MAADGSAVQTGKIGRFDRDAPGIFLKRTNFDQFPKIFQILSKLLEGGRTVCGHRIQVYSVTHADHASYMLFQKRSPNRVKTCRIKNTFKEESASQL